MHRLPPAVVGSPHGVAARPIRSATDRWPLWRPNLAVHPVKHSQADLQGTSRAACATRLKVRKVGGWGVERQQLAAAVYVTAAPPLAIGLFAWLPLYVVLPPQFLAVVLLPMVRWPTVGDLDPRGSLATLARDPVIRVMAEAAGVAPEPWLTCRYFAWAVGAAGFIAPSSSSAFGSKDSAVGESWTSSRVRGALTWKPRIHDPHWWSLAESASDLR